MASSDEPMSATTQPGAPQPAASTFKAWQAAGCVALGAGAGICLSAGVLKLQDTHFPLPEWNHVRPYAFWTIVVPILAYVSATAMWRLRRHIPPVVALGLAVTELGYLGWWLSQRFSQRFVIYDDGLSRLELWCEIGIVAALIIWLFSLPRDLYRHYLAQTELTPATLNRTIGYLASLSVGSGLALDYLARMVQMGTAPWGIGGGALCGLIMIPVVQGLETGKPGETERPKPQWPSVRELVFIIILGAATGLCLHVLFLVLSRSIVRQELFTPLAACIAVYALCITGACVACVTRHLVPRGCGGGFWIAEALFVVMWLAAHGLSPQRAVQDAWFWPLAGWAGAAGILCGGRIAMKRQPSAEAKPPPVHEGIEGG